ncbi:hypothetical protein [Mangrovibacterium diazotrophicum]|uniref:Uncharacterized protein n=1 Tax=Mangrovibacterium diazotrophicum TaxID=1261403 RepID=A0A419W9J9_9BACT|nr:hypothetical protein [Mangrovibacterium diazotrophicum]RKD92082.1 hypothetical protein BC643_2452 [Mangrovibacterium diazotrophicum]
MKTTIYKRNNSGSQFRNHILRIGALAASMVLFSFVLFGQDDWQKLLSYSSMGEMARIMVAENEKLDETPATTNTEIANFELNEESDQDLEIESWMTDAGFFSSFNIEEAAEPELNLESWMNSDLYFQNYQVAENDCELEIESWMTDEDFWAVK